jgi:hypothetical protein
MAKNFFISAALTAGLFLLYAAVRLITQFSRFYQFTENLQLMLPFISVYIYGKSDLSVP